MSAAASARRSAASPGRSAAGRPASPWWWRCWRSWRRIVLLRLGPPRAGRAGHAADRAAVSVLSCARVPERPVAGGEHGEDRRRREHVDLRCRAGAAALRHSPTASSAAGASPRTAKASPSSAIIAPSGSVVDLAPVHALGFAVETLGVQHVVHRAARARAFACRRTARRNAPRPGAGIRSRAGDRRRTPSPRRGRTIRCSCRPRRCGGDC